MGVAQSILISFCDDGDDLWEAPRNLRKMSDGRVGVVYRRRVYPVNGQNVVEISDPWEDPSDCPLIPVTNDVRRLWFLDTSGRSTYLVWRGYWRGDQSEVAYIVTALKSAGIQVRGYGPSTRPASNGIKYEWWVRLGDGESPSDQVLDEVFQSRWAPQLRVGGEPPTLGPPVVVHLGGYVKAEPRNSQPGPDDSDLIKMSQAELERFQELVWSRTLLWAQSVYQEEIRKRAADSLVRALNERVQQQHRALAEAKAELGNQQARWESERNGLLSKLKQASEQIAALLALPGMNQKDTQRLEDRRQEAVEREQAALAERDREAERATKLQAEHADCDGLLTDVGNENTALRNKNAALDAVVAELKTQVEQLKSAEGMWRVQAQAKNPDTARFVALVQQIRVAIFPRVNFISDIDIVTILTSVSNARSLLTVLREIDQGTAKGKKIAELDGWYETHFSTGEDDAGRVYWRQVGQDWYVYVGFKDGQQGDISKLRRWRPPR